MNRTARHKNKEQTTIDAKKRRRYDTVDSSNLRSLFDTL
jgi:hypothetical protein